MSNKDTQKFPEFIKDRVYRVLINYAYKDDCHSSGAGFFIGPNKFLTCCHVILGSDLKVIRTNPEYQNTSGENEHARLHSYFMSKDPGISVELHDGTRHNARLVYFDAGYDIAVLEVDGVADQAVVCDLDLDSSLTYGDEIAFGGFPSQFSYSYDKTPYAYHEGLVSSFPVTTIAGDEYEHLQINSINLSGNSGAPLFRKGKQEVIGIINGNMNWGRDDLVIMKNSPGQAPILDTASNRVPLSICYATTLNVLKRTEALK